MSIHLISAELSLCSLCVPFKQMGRGHLCGAQVIGQLLPASQVALVVKTPPANVGDSRDWVRSLSQEDPLE